MFLLCLTSELLICLLALLTSCGGRFSGLAGFKEAVLLCLCCFPGTLLSKWYFHIATFQRVHLGCFAWFDGRVLSYTSCCKALDLPVSIYPRAQANHFRSCVLPEKGFLFLFFFNLVGALLSSRVLDLATFWQSASLFSCLICWLPHFFFLKGQCTTWKKNFKKHLILN